MPGNIGDVTQRSPRLKILVNLEAEDRGLGGFLIAVVDQFVGVLFNGSRLDRMVAVTASALRVARGLDLGVGITVRRGF